MTPRPLSILFVGNSYTFYNEMPAQVAGLAANDPGAPAITTDRTVQGGASLELHHDELGSVERIRDGDWTHVVLQEMSTGTLHDEEDFHTYVDKLAHVARAAESEVVLYQTWARKKGHTIYLWGWSGRNPETMVERVSEAYERAAERLDAIVAPVGRAWARCIEKHPRLELYDDDLHHASPLGSHLAAAVFYVTLTGRDPTAIPYAVEGVSKEDAYALRAVAWDTARP
ncbi:MAG: DUF4886 domain-containing protein [Sandaracinaceae bacterium]